MEKSEMNALVVRARGGEEEALAELWGAVSKFIRMKAASYAKNSMTGRVTKEDLEQAGFFAVYDAVKVYDETRGTSFLTILTYYLQKRFAEEAGIRTSRRDGLQYADSTERALYSNEDSMTIADTLEDENAALELEGVEYKELVAYARRVILAALDGLPEGYRVLLKGHYLDGVPLTVAAAVAGYDSRASASQAHIRALHYLRVYSKYKGELRA